MPKNFHITTFGCQMNEHDSEIIAGILSEKGMLKTDEKENADVAIINTCSIRENADKRFFGTLGQLKKLKEAKSDFIVCVCGCMMQQEHIVEEVKQKYPWVDIVIGTHNLADIYDLIEQTVEERHRIVEILKDSTLINEHLPADRKYKYKSLVNIMFGCDNFCTYCVVPYTRGREKSRNPHRIVDEIKYLAQDGVKEVTLLGQNVNSYKSEETDFAGLIEMINDVDGIERIRFMTSHPKDLSDRLIEAYIKCDKLCKSIHLPLQSGSDRVLRRMNRRYDANRYMSLVEKIKKAVPDITISTDIIVGFPGETEEDFVETLNIVKAVEYDSAFTFLYSIRKGTPAAKFDEQIPEGIKHERFNRLVEVINDISAMKNQKYLGRVEDVLVEGVSKNNKQALSGRSDGFKLVNFRGSEELIGNIVPVKITEAKTFSLFGELKYR